MWATQKEAQFNFFFNVSLSPTFQGDSQHRESIWVQAMWEMFQEEQHIVDAPAYTQVRPYFLVEICLIYKCLAPLIYSSHSQRYSALPLSVLWQEIPSEKRHEEAHLHSHRSVLRKLWLLHSWPIQGIVNVSKAGQGQCCIHFYWASSTKQFSRHSAVQCSIVLQTLYTLVFHTGVQYTPYNLV